MQMLKLTEYSNRDGFGWKGQTELENGSVVSVEVAQDTFPGDSPRDWGSLGTMVCWHRRYNLGDVQPKGTSSGYWREMAMQLDPTAEDRIEFWEWGDGSLRSDADYRINAIIQNVIDREVAVLLPVYLYDHSGITMSTKPFSCPWDSGQVGFIYATKEDIRKAFLVKRVTKKVIERAKKTLVSEVAVYDDYLTGNVWGYSIEVTHPETCGECGNTEHIEDFEDSCWGFYGDPTNAEYGVLGEVNGILKDYEIEIDF